MSDGSTVTVDYLYSQIPNPDFPVHCLHGKPLLSLPIHFTVHLVCAEPGFGAEQGQAYERMWEPNKEAAVRAAEGGTCPPGLLCLQRLLPSHRRHATWSTVT